MNAVGVAGSSSIILIKPKSDVSPSGLMDARGKAKTYFKTKLPALKCAKTMPKWRKLKVCWSRKFLGQFKFALISFSTFCIKLVFADSSLLTWQFYFSLFCFPFFYFQKREMMTKIIMKIANHRLRWRVMKANIKLIRLDDDKISRTSNRVKSRRPRCSRSPTNIGTNVRLTMISQFKFAFFAFTILIMFSLLITYVSRKTISLQHPKWWKIGSCQKR